MERHEDLSQDARRKAEDERAAAHRAERHDQTAEMNAVRDASGGDYAEETRDMYREDGDENPT
ncbi:hypothetical protein [Nocardia sp. NPDC051570]|uniref:hypothetical protein n=1 Tax=Nocardia sp. NPDC051570 TaxID=3364324 RepID=UPI003796B489